MARVLKNAAAAASIGVTAATLSNWKHQAWWNPDWHTSEGWDVEAIKARPNAAQNAERGKLDADSRKMNQAERAMRLQLMKMKVDERAGTLVNLQEVIAGIKAADEGLVGVIMDIPIRAARLLPEGKLRTELMTEIELICRNALRSHADSMRHQLERAGETKPK